MTKLEPHELVIINNTIVFAINPFHYLASIRREGNHWGIRCSEIDEDLERMTRARLIKLGRASENQILAAFCAAYNEIF
jgi:hypothetical protein